MVEQPFEIAHGRYQIIRALAEGGMSQVYLGVLRGVGGFQKRVVIKVLHPNFVNEPEYIDMFFEEARLLAQMQHPHIVQVFEIDCVGNIPYMVMEYVNGPTLGRLHKVAARLGRADQGHMLNIMAQVCRGLHHAHSASIDGQHGVIHRDVSSQNVLIEGATGVAKLIDFGIAKATAAESKTQVGLLKGKLQYLAPEVLGGGRPDARSDIFAVGVLLYRLLGHRMPFSDQDVSARMAGQYVPLSEVVPYVSPRLERVVDRALKPLPEERYATVAELATDLAQEAERLGSEPAGLVRWMEEIFPGGETDWSNPREAPQTASTLYTALTSQKNESPVLSPQLDARRSAFVAGVVAALVALLTLSLSALVGLALYVTYEPEDTMPAIVLTGSADQDALQYLQAAEETLKEGKPELALALNVKAEQLGITDPAIVIRVMRQKDDIERAIRTAASSTASAAEASPVGALRSSSLPSRLPSLPAPVVPPPVAPLSVPSVVEPTEAAGTAEVAPVPPPAAAEAPAVPVAEAAVQTAPPPEAIRVFHSSELTLKSRADPQYPAAARLQRLGEARCMATVLIDDRGVPYEVTVAGCPKAFHDSTIEAIRRWRWEPPRDERGKIKARTTIAVTYKLG
jgi:serine/threonine protein kinase/outer membrane biosynthesis protein TonB